MVKREKINDKMFVTQTTFYVYGSEKDMKKDNYTLCTSDLKTFEDLKAEEICNVKCPDCKGTGDSHLLLVVCDTCGGNGTLD